jgi:hypothetical protein
MQTRLSVLAIFLGSFLLFGIQPMLSRTLLPAFGGAASVWTVCLAAYQMLLLVGYGYAHLLAGKSFRTVRRLHLGLLFVSVLWLFGFAAFRLTIKNHLGAWAVPSFEILFCVQLFIGLPYVLLSANSTLLQAWLAHSDRMAGAERSRDVYSLYAVSNLGSLLGLLLYPFVLEPFVSLDAQWYGLAFCMLLHSLLLTRLTWGAGRSAHPEGGEAPERGAAGSATAADAVQTHGSHPTFRGLPPSLSKAWLWFALPALSAFLLNAVTMHLSADVTPMPLLWVLLLTAFLLSYILGFSGFGEKGLLAWAILTALLLLGSAFINGERGLWSLPPQVLIGVATVFACCSFLHAWLYRIRPETERLTRFYLGIAAGGAFGGICASVVAPVVFLFVLEYPLALVLTAGACGWLIFSWKLRQLKAISALLLLCLALSVYLLATSTLMFSRKGLFFARDFYGCLRLTYGEVKLGNNAHHPVLKLIHGCTLHGMRSLDKSMKNSPTAYYGENAGGLSVRSHAKYGTTDAMRVALIGLGSGTMACYGRPHDLYRFFEINPCVVDIATNTNFFTFLTDSRAKVEFVVGDARKRLEEERRRNEPTYDVLVVDAFSGDYVPLHLATKEAFQLYMDRLSPNGILALHISNWHMDLLPLCKAAAQTLRLQAAKIETPTSGLLIASDWVFFTRQPMVYKTPEPHASDWSNVRTMSLPSDEKGSLISLIDLNIKGMSVGK